MMNSKQIVYIIDDDLSIRRGFKRLLGAHGYDAQVFASAREFLAGGLPDANFCLIIDVAMPEMDGLQLYAELLRRGCQAPVIFITALDDPAVRKSVKHTRRAAFFQKPVDADALLDALKWMLPEESSGIKLNMRAGNPTHVSGV